MKHNVRAFAGEARNNSHCTMIVEGTMNPELIKWIRGGSSEQNLFIDSDSGRYTASQWVEFKAAIHEINRYPIFIIVETENNIVTAKLMEGNHRLRACMQLGIPVNFEVRFFGHAHHEKLAHAIEQG